MRRGLQFERPAGVQSAAWAVALLQKVFEVRALYSVNSGSSNVFFSVLIFLSVMKIVILYVALCSRFVRMFLDAVGELKHIE